MKVSNSTKHIFETYFSSVDFTGVLNKVMKCFGREIDTMYGTLKCGSSKHGNNLRALFGLMCVAR